MLTRWLPLAVAVVSEVAGSLALKAAVQHPAYYLLTVVGYLTAFSCLSLVLRRGMGVGVAYGIWAAAGVALTAVLSAVLFGESFTAVMAAGLVLIVGGVLLVELGSQTARRRQCEES